jgi:imidazolonepropionase-like amidohydrolase
MNCIERVTKSGILIITFLMILSLPSLAQTHEGDGPYKKLVIRGATMIDGTGAPAKGPVDIVIKGDKIVQVKSFSFSHKGQELNDEDLIQGADHVIDARGMYVTPGFIDMHTHPADFYPYKSKLYLGHGITTVRVLTFGNEGTNKMKKLRKRSSEGKIAAPRVRICQGKSSFDTPKEARKWVRSVKQNGVNCIGESGPTDPDVMAAYLSEADSLGMPTMIHIGFGNTMSAMHAAELGLDEMEHFYGLFESILKDYSLRDFPLDYNENSEDDRYPLIGWLAEQSYGPGSKQWEDLIATFKENEFILDPTMIIYQFVFNLMKARNADWMAEYAMPKLWESFHPNPLKHSGIMAKLSSVNETQWRRYLNKWMRFLYDYNLAGGRVTVGTDANSVYQLEGFSYIEEMILLEQAGLTPLEVIRSATLYGAEGIFKVKKNQWNKIKYGIIRPGKKADLVLMTENPLKDFKVLYGTGAIRLNRDTGEISRIKAIKYTIKDGIVYDSQQLLKDVRQMVKKAEQQTGIEVNIPPLLHPTDENMN